MDNFERVIEEVNRDIVNHSLTFQEGDHIMSVDVHNYIETFLTDEDKLACLHYNRGHVRQLMMCHPESVMVARQAVPAMMNLLRNNNYLSY